MLEFYLIRHIVRTAVYGSRESKISYIWYFFDFLCVALSDREVQGLPRQNMAQQLNRTDFLGQVEHLRKFDINNVFVLGTLETLHFVISKYFTVWVFIN